MFGSMKNGMEHRTVAWFAVVDKEPYFLCRFKVHMDARSLIDNAVFSDALPCGDACAVTLKRQPTLLGKPCSLTQRQPRKVRNKSLPRRRCRCGLHPLFFLRTALCILRRLGKRIAGRFDMCIAQQLCENPPCNGRRNLPAVKAAASSGKILKTPLMTAPLFKF